MNNLINKLSEDLVLKQKIIDLYINENLSKAEVCIRLELSNHILSNLLKIFGIKKDKSLIVNKRKQTCLDKYGVDNPSKSDQVKNIISTKNKLNSDIIVNKGKLTKLSRYGSVNYNNSEKSKLTKKIKYNNENFNNRSKYKNTMLSNYGVENGFQLKKTLHKNLENVLDNSEYSDKFKELFSDRDKAIEFLNSNSYSYYELSTIFNAPYYTVQAWATRLEIKDYISFKFIGKSHYEDDICEFLKSLNISNICRNEKILDGQEIDIYLPDFKIGIEFNGDFWHSDLYKDNNYHQQKSLIAQSKEIRLIHIYEHEWKDTNMKEKLKSLLRIATGNVITKIAAKKCTVKQISNKEARVLNEQIHLQGHRNAQITYGLFYKGKLVQLMSFSKNRKYEWEIIRGCPGSNNIVIGGVEKLFKHFIRDYSPKEIFSYCDFNKFNGKSYEKIGMTYIGLTAPDMKYLIKGKVVNRQPSRYKEIKSLIDARLYGAGSKKYLWVNPELN